MTLRLPEPLPYDFVDEMLDAEYDFVEQRLDQETSKFIAYRKDRNRGNFTRPMWSLVIERAENYEADEYGYFDDTHGWLGGYHWFPEELSEEAIDKIVANL